MNTTEITQYTSLAAAEAAIVRATQEAWLTMGEAFRAIYDQHLWATAHKHYASFKDYLNDKWRISEDYAMRLIRAYETVRQIRTAIPNCTDLPENYGHALAMASHTPETASITWMLILGTTPEAKRTAQYIKAVADTVETMLRTGALEVGDGHMQTIQAIAAQAAPAVTEAAYEAMQRQREYIRAGRAPALLNETFLSLEEAAARLGNLSHAGQVRVVVYPVEENQ